MEKTSESLDKIIENKQKLLIETRLYTLCSEMNIFIKRNKYSLFLEVNHKLLKKAILDYYTKIIEIYRVSGLESINEQTIVSCLCYYILYNKPIQIYRKSKKNNKIFKSINERFVLLYILDYLSGKKEGNHILLKSQSNKEINTMIEVFFQLLMNGVQSEKILQSLIDSFMIYLHLYNK